jgi:hypothetical protein
MMKVFEACVLEELEPQLRGFAPPTNPYPCLPDKWVATSLLQKAVRRGHVYEALRAASYLLSVEPTRFWRRIATIAWEDVAFGNLDLCYQVTVVSGSKRWRGRVGGEWRVASYLVTSLCNSLKDRSTDDLATALTHSSTYADERDSLLVEPRVNLAQISAQNRRLSTPVASQALSAWYQAGTEKWGFEGPPERQGDISWFYENHEFDPDQAVFMVASRLGVTRTRTVLPVLAIPLHSRWTLEAPTSDFTVDQLDHHTVATVPSYAFDGFTRAGRRYLKSIARRHSGLSKTLNHAEVGALALQLLRKLHFRTTASLVDKRLDWHLGQQFRDEADRVGFGLPVDLIEDGKFQLLDAMRQYPISEADL